MLNEFLKSYLVLPLFFAVWAFYPWENDCSVNILSKFPYIHMATGHKLVQLLKLNIVLIVWELLIVFKKAVTNYNARNDSYMFQRSYQLRSPIQNSFVFWIHCKFE